MQEKRVLEGEFILWTLVLLSVDAFCFLLDFTGVGDFITPFIQSGLTATTTMWFYQSKGSNDAIGTARQITKHLLNVIPWLPTLTVVFFVETYLHNHPKLRALTEKAIKKPEISKKPSLNKPV